MSIINQTQDQIYAAAFTQRMQHIQILWKQIQFALGETAEFIYNCPLKDANGLQYTAQAAFNLAGTNGVDLCKLSDAATGMVAAYIGSAPTIPPTGYVLTKNSDGTVTVTPPTA
jgi:hypothetical protein